MADGGTPPQVKRKFRPHVVPSGLQRAYRVRVYPKPKQAAALRRLFGARRYFWNWALQRKNDAYRKTGRSLTGTDLSRELTQIKTAPDTAWMAELPREPFNQTLRDFDRAWKRYFDFLAAMKLWRAQGCKGPRSTRVGRPRKRRYGTVRSARFTLDQRRIGAMVEKPETRAELVLQKESTDPRAVVGKAVHGHGAVILPGVGRLRFRMTEAMPGELLSVTVSQDAAGRWFGCFAADGVPQPNPIPARRPALGVDLGLHDTATFDTGEKVPAPKYLTRHLRKLKRYQRHFVRQRDAAARRAGIDPKELCKRHPKVRLKRGQWSRRMMATQHRTGTLHARVADARRNSQHQLTVRLIAEADVVCIESLAVKAMGRSMHHGFRRGVADAGLGEILRQIRYKAKWYQRVVSAVGRWYPSSKTCHVCGHVNHGLKLKDRRWQCPHCHAWLDRDINAAINILREGLRLLAEGSSTPRSGGIYARGEGMRAAGCWISPDEQQPAENREPVLSVALPRTPARGRRERLQAGAG